MFLKSAKLDIIHQLAGPYILAIGGIKIGSDSHENVAVIQLSKTTKTDTGQ